MLADGGDCISDLAVLREQSALFGEVASTATAWRVLDSIDDAGLDRLRAARAAAPALSAWAAGAAPARVILDIDATLVTAHSEKEGANADLQARFRLPPAAVLRRPRRRGGGRGRARGHCSARPGRRQRRR